MWIFFIFDKNENPKTIHIFFYNSLASLLPVLFPIYYIAPWIIFLNKIICLLKILQKLSFVLLIKAKCLSWPTRFSLCLPLKPLSHTPINTGVTINIHNCTEKQGTRSSSHRSKMAKNSRALNHSVPSDKSSIKNINTAPVTSLKRSISRKLAERYGVLIVRQNPKLSSY